MAEIYASYGSWKYSKASVKARGAAIIRALDELRKSVQFGAVVVTGSSGVWLGGLLQANDAWPEDCPIILCRKEGEGSHGPIVECNLDCRPAPKRVVLLDDFVDSGGTLARVQKAYAPFGRVVAVLEHDTLLEPFGSTVERTGPLELRHCTCTGIPLYSRE